MGYEGNDGESCTCPICLEPLLQSNTLSSADGSTYIGTTVPCGHCLHVHCWDQWTATSIGRLQGRSTPIHIKCPLCNVPTTSFVRLYLNLSTTSSSLLDNDDDSLFDTEDEVQIVDSGTDDSTKESAPPESIKETKGKGDENGGGDESFRRSKKYLICKGMLRKLQHESKLLQSQYQEKNDHFQQLQSKVQTHEQKLRELQVKVDQLEQVQKSNQLTMDGISYEMIQLKRDFQNLKNKAKGFEEQSKQKDIQISELKQRFDQRIKDLQKKQENMKEIQHILTERPKLVEEVRSLKEKLRRVQQRQQESFPAHVEGRETTHTRKEITLPKKHGIDNASHKQRKRMLLAIREELEETENTSHFRKQRTAQEMQRIDEPNSSALPATSHAKTLVTELLKRPSKAPSQVGNQRTLVSQVTHRSENQITSLLAIKPPHMLANLPSAPRNIAPPPQSKEVSARPTATHRKQATLLQFCTGTHTGFRRDQTFDSV